MPAPSKPTGGRRRARVTAPPAASFRGRRKPDLLRRQQALAKTMGKYRHQGRALGKADCVTMGRSHLVAMGHTGLPKVPRYGDARGALKALKDMGVETVEQLFDRHLPRIAPAAMLPGDIGLAEAEDGLGGGAIVIALGGQKYMGWHDDHPTMVVMVISELKAAWRA